MRSLYEIAVKLTMVNHAGPVLSAITHQLLGVHHHINQATAASNRFRVALVAAGTALVGGELLAGMAKLVDHGGEFARTIDRMKLAGWSGGLINEATRNAFSTAQLFPSLSASLIMEMQREMAPVLGSREEAMHVTGTLAQLMRILQVHRGPEATQAIHGEIIAAVRAGELTANTLTDERFLHFMDMMAPSMNAWGSLLGPRDFAMAFKYSRAAGLNMSDRFMKEALPTLMQELGASTTGTSFQTAFQAVVGGRMRLASINAFADMGLIDQSRVRPENLTPEGRLRRMQPGLIVDSSLYMRAIPISGCKST